MTPTAMRARQQVPLRQRDDDLLVVVDDQPTPTPKATKVNPLLADVRQINVSIEEIRGRNRRLVESILVLDFPRLRSRHLSTPTGQLVAATARDLGRCIDLVKTSDAFFDKALGEPDSLTADEVTGYAGLVAEVTAAFESLRASVVDLHSALK